MKVIYVAGPFRAATPWLIEQNVRRAEEASLQLWKHHIVALCPHLNGRYFSGEAPDVVWLAGGLELLRRCDAVYVLPGSEQSSGTQAEIEEAIKQHIPVLHSLEACIELFG